MEASGSHAAEFREIQESTGNSLIKYLAAGDSAALALSALWCFISICQLQPIRQQFRGHGGGNSGSNRERKSLRYWGELGAGFWCCQGKKKKKCKIRHYHTLNLLISQSCVRTLWPRCFMWTLTSGWLPPRYHQHTDISSDGRKVYVLYGVILSNRILFQWLPGSSSPLDCR